MLGLTWWERQGFVRIERELRSHWAQVRHAGGNLRAQVLNDALAWAEQVLAHVPAVKTAIEEEFRDLWESWFQTPPPVVPRRRYYMCQLAFFAELGAWCFVGLESFLAAILSVLFVAAPWWLATLIGIATTVALAIGLKGVVAPLLVAKLEAMPRAALSKATVWLAVSFPIEFVLIGVVLFARGVSTDATDLAFAAASGLLAIMTPIVAAILFTIAGLLGWSGRLTVRWQRLSRLERDIRSLREHCLQRLAAAEAEAPLRTQPRQPTPSAAALRNP